MWIRKTLDISARDILAGMQDCLAAGSSMPVKEKITALWEKGTEKAVVCFSVRTGFDLLLQAVDFERGSEILMSGLTIPDMPRIVKYHGYTPVPIDIDIDTLAPSPESIESAITDKTRALIVAHLFGNVTNLKEISKIARAHNLVLIEDCAQTYQGPSFTGTDVTDISMFSFGTIKTATALGGGILVIRNNDQLAGKINSLHTAYPVQSKLSYFKKLTKYLFLKLLFPPAVFRCVVTFLKKTRVDYDNLLQSLSRSFPGEDLLSKIRLQPSFPLLKVMLRRFETFSEKTILERIRLGGYLLENLPATCQFPGIRSEKHTFWVFPILHNYPDELIQDLRNSGFDATQKHSLRVMKSADGRPDNEMLNCSRIVRNIVYLPLYRQIPTGEINRIANCMKASGKRLQKKH